MKLTVTQALTLLKKGSLTKEEREAVQALLVKKTPSSHEPKGRHGEVRVVYEAPPELQAKMADWNDPHDPPPFVPRDQRTALNKVWQSRSSFVQCKNCGGRDTYKSIDPTFTKNRIWCYTCGAYDLRVTLDPDTYEMFMTMMAEKKGK